MNDSESKLVQTQGRPPYQGRSLKPSSLGTPAVTYLSSEPVKSAVLTPPGGGLEKHETAGRSGALIFVDCDGAEVGRITWKRGDIQESGEQTIEAGCDGSSSS